MARGWERREGARPCDALMGGFWPRNWGAYTSAGSDGPVGRAVSQQSWETHNPRSADADLDPGSEGTGTCWFRTDLLRLRQHLPSTRMAPVQPQVGRWRRHGKWC